MLASRKRRRPSFLAPLSFGPEDVAAKLQGIPDDFLIQWVHEQGLHAANRQQAIGQINYAFGGDVEPVLAAYREWRERAGEPEAAGAAARDEPTVGEMVGQVGEKVGDTVGGTVGTEVGETVGRQVGEKVGDTVGEMVGDTVGDQVGQTVGGTVGQKVGSKVGEKVGAEVGQAVGETVGLKVGQKVGGEATPSGVEPGAGALVRHSQPAGKPGAPLSSGESTGVEQVGSMVGDTVGGEVGRQVGAEVGQMVGTKVGEEVGNTVGSVVGQKVGDTVGEMVGETVGAEVGGTVGPAVGNKVGRVVGREVGSEVGGEVGSTVGSGGGLKRAQVGQGAGGQVSRTVGEKGVGRAGDVAGALRKARRAARELQEPRLAAFVRQTDEGLEVVLLGGAERLHLQRGRDVVESKGPSSDQELADWLSDRMRVWAAFRAGKGAGLRSQALYLRDYEFQLLERLMREFDLAHYKVVGLSAEALAWHVSRGRSVPVSHPPAEVKKRIGVGLLKLPAPEEAGRRRTYDLPDATAALLRALSVATGRDISAIANLAINALGTVCGLAG